jgi:hypothetical protein
MMNGETIATGAASKCNDCGVELKLAVHKSAAGFYLGTWCNCGPYSRESGYYDTREEAEKALKTADIDWR